MKSSAAVCVVLLVFLVSSAAALNCYTCNDCGSSRGSSQQCLPGFDTCMKLTVGNQVGKTCNLKIACETLQNADSTAVQAVVRKLIGGGNLGGDLTVDCCGSDYCNTATTSFINPLLLFLSTLMFLFRF